MWLQCFNFLLTETVSATVLLHSRLYALIPDCKHFADFEASDYSVCVKKAKSWKRTSLFASFLKKLCNFPQICVKFSGSNSFVVVK